MGEYKRYQQGRDFTITLESANLAPADYLVAELIGPIEARGAQTTILKTRADRQKATAGRNNYVLRGPVPTDAPLGRYHLSRLTVYHDVGNMPPQDFPERELPELSIIIEPHSPDEPPPLPTITKAE